MVEGDGSGEVTADAATHVLTDLKPKLTAAQPQHGFKLGVALKAFRHVGHVLRRGLRRPEITVAHKFLMLALQLLPALHEPVRALEGIDADFRLRLHRPHGLMAAPFRRLADQFRASPERAVQIGGAFGPDGVEGVARLLQRLALVWHSVDALRAGLPDRVHRLGVAFDRAAQSACAHGLRVMLALLLAGRIVDRRGSKAAKVQPVEHAALCFRYGWRGAILPGQREAQAVEDPARLLRYRPDDFRDALAKADAAPLGIVLHGIDLAVVARHVLGALARQDADKAGVVLEVVAPVVKRHAFTVARHADIGAVPVHPRRGEHMRAVH
eukprot:Opistho-2@59658